MPLVEASLRRTDLADAIEELVQVVSMTWTWRVREPLVVHGEALDEVLAEPFDRPLLELGAARTSDAEADGEDDFEPVVPEVA